MATQTIEIKGPSGLTGVTGRACVVGSNVAFASGVAAAEKTVNKSVWTFDVVDAPAGNYDVALVWNALDIVTGRRPLTNITAVFRIDSDIAAITGPGAGTGARSVTITVNDGATALQNANVRMSQGAESYVVATNASGVAVFALDDATWTVGITMAGYTFTTTTIVVNGVETQTYSMTAVSITPSDPGETTGYVTIRTAGHVAVVSAIVEIEIVRWPNGFTGSGIADPLVSATTNSSGYAEFVGLPRSTSYRVRVGGGDWFDGVTADAATTPLAAVLGIPT